MITDESMKAAFRSSGVPLSIQRRTQWDGVTAGTRSLISKCWEVSMLARSSVSVPENLPLPLPEILAPGVI